MSLDISYYRKINNSFNDTYTITKKDSEIYMLKQHMAKTFSDSLDYHNESFRNSTKQRFVITYHKDKDKKKITAFPDEELFIGDLIDCYGLKWLVTDLDKDQTVYTKGTIQKCNYTLPFQNGTSTIINEPCIVLSQSDALSGEDTGNVITIPDTQRVIYLQYNENTSKLTEGKRLFIDRLCANPKVFHISKIDRICYMQGNNGLWKLTCDEDAEIKESDRKDLMIANYIEPSTPTPVPTPTSSGKCAITNTSNVVYDGVTNIAICKIGGSERPFVPHFYNASNVEVTNCIPVWSLSGLTTTQIDKIHLRTNDNKYPTRAYIKVDNDTSLIDSKFTLHLADNSGLLSTYDVIVEVKSLT